MAFYRFIELAEHVLRQIPKSESEAVLLASVGKRKDMYLLQRGNFPGDVWWDTPDGDSVFNRFRVAACETQGQTYEENDEDNCYSATAHTLAVPFTGAERFVIAGSFGCATEEGSEFIRAFEETDEEKDDAFPENKDRQNMLKIVLVTKADINDVRMAFETLRVQADRAAAAA